MMKKFYKNLILIFVFSFAFTSFTLASSWGNINQPVLPLEEWTSYVENSPFALGEKKELKLDKLTLWEMDFGTYPSIDGSTVAVPMAIEFARQHLPLKDLDLEGFVSFSTTHGAYEHLIKKQPNIAAQLPSQNTLMSQSHPVDLL